jgi:hypothetical protein
MSQGLLVACAFSAGVHVALAPDHLGESALLGLGFLGSAAMLSALGLGIYARPGSVRLPPLIAFLSGHATAHDHSATRSPPAGSPARSFASTAGCGSSGRTTSSGRG